MQVTINLECEEFHELEELGRRHSQTVSEYIKAFISAHLADMNPTLPSAPHKTVPSTQGQ